MKKKTVDSQVQPVVRPGFSYNIFFGTGNPNNKKIHVRAVVDEHWIVYRSRSKRKQRWVYEIDYDYFFQLLARDGNIKKV